MTDFMQQRTAAILKAAHDAHHAYEKDELGEKRDEQWAAWYADYLATNDLGELLGKGVDLDDLAIFLEESSRQFKTSDTKDAWHDYMAAHLLETLK
jgi:hypothetical protein